MNIYNQQNKIETNLHHKLITTGPFSNLDKRSENFVSILLGVMLIVVIYTLIQGNEVNFIKKNLFPIILVLILIFVLQKYFTRGAVVNNSKINRLLLTDLEKRK